MSGHGSISIRPIPGHVPAPVLVPESPFCVFGVMVEAQSTNRTPHAVHNQQSPSDKASCQPSVVSQFE